LWHLFISVRLGVDGALTYTDLIHYGALTGADISPWEADVLVRLDVERRHRD